MRKFLWPSQKSWTLKWGCSRGQRRYWQIHVHVIQASYWEGRIFGFFSHSPVIPSCHLQFKWAITAARGLKQPPNITGPWWVVWPKKLSQPENHQLLSHFWVERTCKHKIMLFVRSLLQTLAEKYVFRVVKPVKNLENAKKSPILTTNLTFFLFKPKTRNLLPNLFFLYLPKIKWAILEVFGQFFIWTAKLRDLCVCDGLKGGSHVSHWETLPL